ncbi:MAG: DUF2254 domain-containing protein [Rhodospirillales bacterium]
MHSYLKGQLRAIRSALWFRPSAFCLLAAGFAILLAAADALLPLEALRWLPTVEPVFVRDILQLLSGSMLTVSTLVLSALMLVLNLVAGQATPRAVPELMADPVTQNALGIFLATFVFSITALMLFGLGAYSEAAVTLVFFGAILLVAISLRYLLQWIHHVADALKLNRVIERLAGQARRVLENYLEADDGAGGPADREWQEITKDSGGLPVYAGSAGYIQLIDFEPIGSILDEHDLRLQFVCHVGDFLHASRPFAWVAGLKEPDQDLLDSIASGLVIGAERSSQDDPQLGIELLTEVASRSLSPGINDPKSALACIDYLISLLSTAGKVPPEDYPAAVLCDGRVRVRRQTYADLLERAWRPIVRDGGAHAEVICGILNALVELASIVDPGHLDAIREEGERALAFGKELLRLETDRESLDEISKRLDQTINARTGQA